jgi:hypothetical protein
MTPAEQDRKRAADRRHADYMRELEHELLMKDLRAQGEKWRAQDRRLRRSEEDLSVSMVKLTYNVAAYKARFDGKPILVELARRRLRQQVEPAGLIQLGAEADVARWRQHATSWQARTGVEVRWEALPATNAYAITAGATRTIETAPIVSAESYITWAHEAGHCENPCQPAHVRVPRTSGDGTLCVRCEILAWRWAQKNATDWRLAMHRQMAESIVTYRPYGTPAEQAEIDTMISPLAFRRVQLARAVGVQA